MRCQKKRQATFDKLHSTSYNTKMYVESTTNRASLRLPFRISLMPTRVAMARCHGPLPWHGFKPRKAKPSQGKPLPISNLCVTPLPWYLSLPSELSHPIIHNYSLLFVYLWCHFIDDMSHIVHWQEKKGGKGLTTTKRRFQKDNITLDQDRH